MAKREDVLTEWLHKVAQGRADATNKNVKIVFEDDFENKLTSWLQAKVSKWVDSFTAYSNVIALGDDGKPAVDDKGKPVGMVKPVKPYRFQDFLETRV